MRRLIRRNDATRRTVKRVATAYWYGYTGTPPPPLDVPDEVPDVEVVKVDEESEEDDAVDKAEELDEAEELVVEVEAVVTAEPPYSTTLSFTPSATHRFPLESNARPVGWSRPVAVGLIG